jgi:hypothetical protein
MAEVERTLGDNSVIQQIRAELRQARQEAAQVSEYEQRATAAEQRAVLAQLGLAPDSPQARLAEAMHEGEWTTDAVLDTLSEYGAVVREYTPEMVAQHQVADEAATGSSGGYVDPLDELAALPAYGMPGWEFAKQRAYDIVRRAGGEVTYQRPKKEVWINPATGKPITMSQDTPVGPTE